MLKVTHIATAGALFICSTAAVAQDPTGSPARQAQDIFDVSIKDSDYFEVMFRNDPQLLAQSYSDALRFASCAAKLNRGAVGSVLTADAGSQQEARAIRDLSKRYGTCIARRSSVPPLVMRGAMAETLWKQVGADPNPAKRQSIDIADVEIFIRAAPRGETLAKSAGLPLSWVSRCQVMALPLQSAKVLAAQPGSNEELAEATTLYAASNVCGVLKGLGKTPVTAVRASLADALYQDGVRVASRVK